MPRFLIFEPAEAVLDALAEALDRVDFAVILLAEDMRVRFVNDRVADLCALPAGFMARGPNFRELLEQSASEGWFPVSQADLPAYLDDREAVVHAGSGQPVVIPLTDGRLLLFRCMACRDGGRILIYSDIPEGTCGEPDAAARRLNAEMRFNAETMESQAAHLAALAEQSDENAHKAEAARLLLESEVAERRQLEIKLRQMATTDGLTGALNRSELMVVGQQEIEIAQRSGRDLAVLMLDVDHFKAVNDRYGHAGGDSALRHLVVLLRAGIRHGDVLGRIGGEEFAIVLPNASVEAAAGIANWLSSAVARTAVPFGDTQIAMTVSIGLAGMQATDRSIEQIIGRADDALYRAKHAGRNRVVADRALQAAGTL